MRKNHQESSSLVKAVRRNMAMESGASLCHEREQSNHEREPETRGRDGGLALKSLVLVVLESMHP